MKVFSIVSVIVVIVLLGVIAYGTGSGTLFSAGHVDEVSCDSILTRSLFFSSLLSKSDDLKNLAEKVKSADTIDDINKLVVKGSNIDAGRTRWFKSNSDPSTCQAQVFLQTPNEQGQNTAYIEFTIKGFVPTDSDRYSVLESIHLQLLGVKWFSE